MLVINVEFYAINGILFVSVLLTIVVNALQPNVHNENVCLIKLCKSFRRTMNTENDLLLILQQQSTISL